MIYQHTGSEHLNDIFACSDGFRCSIILEFGIWSNLEPCVQFFSACAQFLPNGCVQNYLYCYWYKIEKYKLNIIKYPVMMGLGETVLCSF